LTPPALQRPALNQPFKGGAARGRLLTGNRRRQAARQVGVKLGRSRSLPLPLPKEIGRTFQIYQPCDRYHNKYFTTSKICGTLTCMNVLTRTGAGSRITGRSCPVCGRGTPLGYTTRPGGARRGRPRECGVSNANARIRMHVVQCVCCGAGYPAAGEGARARRKCGSATREAQCR
jgi:hypothetical protein